MRGCAFLSEGKSRLGSHPVNSIRGYSAGEGNQPSTNQPNVWMMISPPVCGLLRPVSSGSRTKPGQETQSLRRERFHVSKEAISCDHNRESPRDRPGEWLCPSITGRIHKKRVPQRLRFRWQRTRRLAVEECREIHQQSHPKQPTLIPVMHNPMIGQEFRGPLHSRVTRVHVEPYGIHLERGLRMPLQDLLLRPTGRCDTAWSSR
jgi:hypothetical protein